MGQWQRRVVVGLCGAVIASLLVGAVGALRSDAGRVVRRPWPSRVIPTGPWTATMHGEGDRVMLTVAGVVEGGLDGAVVDAEMPVPGEPFPGARRVGARSGGRRELLLPGGSRWAPRAPFRLEGTGDVPFADDPAASRNGGPLGTLRAEGSSVRVLATSFEAVLATARSGVVAVGRFTSGSGMPVNRLTLPPGTKLASTCSAEAVGLDCVSALLGRVAVALDARDGFAVRAAGDGEASVAGTVEVEGLGRSWAGLVGALEARELSATAVRRSGRWEVRASGQRASQLWVDVWPVVDTVLAVTSAPAESSFLSNLFGGYDPNTSIDIRNVGFATSQIYETVGRVPLRATASQGHDAGLGVRRPSRWRRGTVGGGSLSPGATSEEELEVTGDAAITLRGNFPDVSVALVT